MLELAADLLERTRSRTPFVVATVTGVAGSAPRQPGSSLVVDADGAVLGNVSGGCVDAAVHEACQEMLAGDRQPQALRFGYSDADAIGVGLTCGGTIELLLRHHDPDAEPELEPALADAASGQAVAVATVVRGPDAHLGRAVVVRPGRPPQGSLGDELLDRVAEAHTIDLLHAGKTGTVEIGVADSYCREPMTLLVESSTPPPRMLVFGAIDHAAALARLGTFLGYRVTVCDARATFATPDRFPGTEVVVDWPHRYLQAQADAGSLDGRAVVCVLTHDPKFDLPLLTAALRMPVAYVGAMGSRRTHEERLTRLRDAGLADHELARLHSPIGLDLGARTPQETALSIAAEIVAHRHGGTGAPLSTGVPIHHSVTHHAVIHRSVPSPRPLTYSS
ncbi:xanthine dehydrogenase accessory factor [Promicromonospora sp. AC04]|uniref:XdhC family protein n=1 Tax=Promicromonospora sp. AC04 TaxID=2135723 RepID=UPI000D34D3B3|nr:XdhC/CoxI family protein [Promicromonospora sp. AC04]PUB31969.1 xanthine dehydrogenase accessory factor [Promicromonospora sp. AC04]